MIHWIAWYVVISLLGWLTFPIAYRLLPALKDRGYTASRGLGLLIWGYFFWLLASLGVLPFTMGGLLFSLMLLVGLSFWALSRVSLHEITAWMRLQSRLILVTELLFLVAFASWAIIRATNPEAAGTEKPMELAFINAILRSPTFPPHDPWLSGYAISYYYFGYVMIAMLAKVTMTTGGVAFNLGICLIFALSACGAYGLVANLLNAAFRKNNTSPAQSPAILTFASLLGPFYVLITSNLEGFLEILHSRGFFWQRDHNGALTSAFWQWVKINDLITPPAEPFSWTPARFWWWWRASRVLGDYDLRMAPREIINEFPFFSFLLADLHPHVLAMPFAFLAITLALNLFLIARQTSNNWLKLRFQSNHLAWAAILAVPTGLVGLIFGVLQLKLSLVALGCAFLIFSGVIFLQCFHKIGGGNIALLFTNQKEIAFHLPLDIDLPGFLLAALALGSMAFLNTWDFPVYLFIYSAAYVLPRFFLQGQKLSQALTSFIWIGLALGICGGALYLPFYLGFSSQAGGILPNLIYPTRGVHLWIMFAPLLAPILGYLIYLQFHSGSWQNLRKGLLLTSGFFLGLAFLALFLGLVIISIPEVSDLYLSSIAAQNNLEIFQEALRRRLISPGAWLTLLLFLSLTFSQLIRIRKNQCPQEETSGYHEKAKETHLLAANNHLGSAHLFTILLILTGLLLVLAPEFVYLRDLFGWRINTIFKFYFQAWLIWSIATAFCAIMLLLRLRGVWSITYRLALIVLIFASLAYPALGIWTKTNGFQPGEWTLDSTAYFARLFPDEMAAIEWLRSAPFGILAEAVPAAGGSYTEYARVSTFSGLPAVLGWVGHENQWRGGNQFLGSRQTDLERLYCSKDWEESRQILDQYQIRYVYISALERLTYRADESACPLGLVETKFTRYLNPVFQAGQVIIYEYSNAAINGTTSN